MYRATELPNEPRKDGLGGHVTNVFAALKGRVYWQTRMEQGSALYPPSLEGIRGWVAVPPSSWVLYPFLSVHGGFSPGTGSTMR
jgi:hypothetical protein